MSIITVSTGSNSFRTFAAKKFLQCNDKKAKIVRAFVTWLGKEEDFPFARHDYLFPAKDIVFSSSKIVSISGNIIDDYVED